MPFPNYAGSGNSQTAMGLYNSAGMSQDGGAREASELGSKIFGGLQQYAPPARGPASTMAPGANAPGSGNADGTYPREYYMGEQPPAKQAVPTAQQERMATRQAVREAASAQAGGGAGVPRPDPITDEEVNYVMAMKDQAELADFDRWVSKLVNPRAPGELAWLRSIYPEYQQRRNSQAHADYQFAIKSQMIDQWGLQSFDDLVFLYMKDQGKIKGPHLTNIVPAGNAYQPSFLGPYGAKTRDQRSRGSGLRLPFASARWGVRPQGDGTPADMDRWNMADVVDLGGGQAAGHPLALGAARQNPALFARQVLNAPNNPDAAGGAFDVDGAFDAWSRGPTMSVAGAGPNPNV